MIDTDKHERILKQYKFRKNELKIYFDRSEEHPLGAYKFRQKDWQVRRFIGDARQARWTLSDMKEIYDEAMEEVKRLREQVKDLEYEVENWKGELSVRMHPIDYDALVNGGEEE